MSVGLLIISHSGIGPALLGTTTHMLNGCPLHARLLTASRESEPEDLMASALELLDILDEGEGVLVLTDLYGSTPSNIAKRLNEHHKVRIISGMNLPMMVRVLNYAQLDLDALAQKAVSGGRDGVFMVTDGTDT